MAGIFLRPWAKARETSVGWLKYLAPGTFFEKISKAGDRFQPMPRIATGRTTERRHFRIGKDKAWVWDRFVRLHKGKTQSEMLWEAMWAWILANDPDLGRGFFATQAKSMIENLHCAFRAGVIEWDGETIRIVESELAKRKKPSGIRGFTADYREPEFRGDIELWNQEETVENIFHAAGMPWDRRRIIDETEARATKR